MKSIEIVRLIISILVCEGAGVIGSFFTVKNVSVWYQHLKKPPYTPPNWLFGPVWITLYLLMGISVYFIWQELAAGSGGLSAFILFWVQLVFNMLWSIAFFGYKSIFGGVVIIIILWLMILTTIITSFRVSAVAGSLLIPYIVWVSIATYLNIGIWRLNPKQFSKPD